MSSHQNSQQKLGRRSTHRMAMLHNLAGSILLYENVRTTQAKAKAVKSVVERLITKAKSGSLHDRRQVLSTLHNNELVTRKLFDVLGPRFSDRNGGYTRILKLDNRPGDNAPMVQIQLVDGE